MSDENKNPGATNQGSAGQKDDHTDQGSVAQKNDQIDQTPEVEQSKAEEEIVRLTEISKRAMADLQNYKRRAEEERTQFARFAIADIVLELLPILDNFKRAIEHVPDEIAKTDWFKGILQIEQHFALSLQKKGVTEIENPVGKQLDPHKHEAVTTGPGEDGIVVEEFEKGYMLGGKVLRPSKVKVGRAESDYSK